MGVSPSSIHQVRRQVSLFLTDALHDPIEALRQRWDPQMAQRIPAHITLLHTIAPTALPGLVDQLAAIAQDFPPFRVHIGRTAVWESPNQGIYLTVEDRDGMFTHLRQRMCFPDVPPPLRPHSTLLHPRTNGLNGHVAWQTLQHVQFEQDTWFDQVAVIEEAGPRWQTIATISLQGRILHPG